MTFPTGKTAADFDFKLGQVPTSWQQPIADVIDTFDVVQIGLKSIGISDPLVVAKAVELVIDRHDRLTAERRP